MTKDLCKLSLAMAGGGRGTAVTKVPLRDFGLDIAAAEECRRNVEDAANVIYWRDIIHYLHTYYFV